MPRGAAVFALTGRLCGRSLRVAEPGESIREDEAMLGERLGESSGKLTGIRVLPTEGQQIKLEASFQGQGTLLGQPISDFGTYSQTMRPDGTLYGEGHVVMLSQSGDAADWIGGGVGRAIGAGFKASYGVYGS